MKRIIKFFSSIKLAISLLICLAFTSIIGTVIAQKQNPILYIKHYGEGLYKFLNFIKIFDVYHSWWFIALLVLLSINILCCALRRLLRDIKRTHSEPVKLDEEMTKRFTLSHTKVVNKSLSECKDTIISNLLKGTKKMPEQEDGDHGEVFIFTEKNRHGWVFFHLTHVSILFILLGGILSALLGIRGHMEIIEGESADKYYEYSSNKPYDLGFAVKCEKFDLEYYPDSMRPKDYKSTLVIYDQGKEVLRKVIEVNDPLSYKGMTLYQSNYGEDTDSGKVILSVNPVDQKSTEEKREFKLSPNGSFEFTGADGKKREVAALRFLPDFGMDDQGKAFSKSSQLNNPAIQIMVTTEGEEPFKLWCFKMYPDFHMVQKGEYVYSFKDYKGSMYTGLQVGKDPGVWVVWLGCVLLMLGVILVLYSSHQRIWIKLAPHAKGCSLQLIGHTNKNKIGFEIKFNNLWQGMLDSLKS